LWGFQTSRRVVERLGSDGAARGVAGSLTGAAAQTCRLRRRSKCANSGSIGCLHSEGSGRPIGAATRTYWPAADFSDRHLHGLLFACRDDRGRPCQPRFAIWPCLPRQIEHPGLWSAFTPGSCRQERRSRCRILPCMLSHWRSSPKPSFSTSSSSTHDASTRSSSPPPLVRGSPLERHRRD
jgi:hypothetical protein